MSETSLPELIEESSLDGIRRLESEYYQQLRTSTIDPCTQLEYAKLLVRSRYPADIWKGLVFLEQLTKIKGWCRRHSSDVLLQLAVGRARLKDYELALAYARRCRAFNPDDTTTIQIQEAIEDEMKKDGLKHLVFSGAVLLITALTCLVSIRYYHKK